MKYIKKFENNNNKVVNYWRINTKYPNIKISLRKIGFPEFDVKYYSQKYRTDDDWFMYFGFTNNGYYYQRQALNCTPGDKDENKKYEDYKFNYMGEIVIEDYEIDSEKYNL